MLQQLPPHSQAHRQEEEEGMAGAAASFNPPKEDHNIFAVGSSVEVLTEVKGCGRVFFSATVIKEPPSFKKSSKSNSKNKLCVEYHDLLFENEPLREYVDLSSVRPQPPASQERVDGCFEEGEVVDVFYNDGWWTGVVTRLVEGEGGESRRVIVTFYDPLDVREFEASDLRPHLRWIDGTWVTPEKQNVVVHSFDDGLPALKISENMALSLMTDRPEESTPVNQKASHVDEANNATERRHSPEPLASSLPPNEGDVSGARRHDESNRTIKLVYRRKCRSIFAAQTVPCEMSSAGENSEDTMQPVNVEVVVEGENRSAEDVQHKLVVDESNHPVLISPKQEGMELDGDNFTNDVSGLINSANEAPFKPSDEAVLPFDKENSLWKTIEAMEAFQRTPQTPHFRPLEKFAKRSREGLAIGLMVTCSTLMEEARNLRLSDPKSITDSILETLTELETHGFDVSVVRNRVNNLIAVKDKQRDNLEAVKRLNNQISEREGEKRRNSEQVDMIKKQIQRLQERLTLIASADAKADEEIACLLARLQETEKEMMDNARREAIIKCRGSPL